MRRLGSSSPRQAHRRSIPLIHPIGYSGIRPRAVYSHEMPLGKCAMQTDGPAGQAGEPPDAQIVEQPTGSVEPSPAPEDPDPLPVQVVSGVAPPQAPATPVSADTIKLTRPAPGVGRPAMP